MSDATITTPHHSLRAWIAQPSSAAPWPGVIVIHDVFGMTTDCRRQAEWLAEAGFLALAPDFYSWGKKFKCLRATFADVQAGRGSAFDDLDAARSWLQLRPDCTGRVGIVGFCMGGRFALFAAVGHGFSVSSVNYGMLPDDPEQTLAGACPIVASFGQRDGMLKGAAARLEQALSTLGVRHDIKEYPGVGHAFMNQHGGALKLLRLVVGASYHEQCEADARRRIVAFFNETLRSPTALD